MTRPTNRARKLPPLDVRAVVRGSSVDPEKRTADVVWTTEAPVLRSIWGDRFHEVLSMNPAHVRMGRLTSGRAPLLSNHNSYDMRGVIGVVERASLQGGKGTATVRFAKAEDDEEADKIFRKVVDGIVANVSVGYRVYKYEKTSGGEGEIPTYRAIDWEPYEISTVPIGADAAAAFRGADGMDMNEVTIITRQEAGTMDEEMSGQGTTEATRAAADAATAAERARVTEIRSLVVRNGLEAEFEVRMVNDSVPLDEVRKQVLDALAARDAAHPIQSHVRVEMGNGGSFEHRAAAIGEAIHARVNLLHKPSDYARQFAGYTMVELARDCLRNAGTPTAGMGAARIIERALHTTSDFALALGDGVGRTLRRAYETADPGAIRLGRQVNMPDFRVRRRIQFGDAPRLLKVNEHGEFTRGTIPESSESFGLATYGRVFGITRQALINDDLGVFDEVPRRFGVEAREMECQLVIDMIAENSGAGPTMADGQPLFHSTHGNLAAEGAAPAVETLGAARTAMRTQQGLTGRVINYAPAFLLVPAALETEGEKILAQITAAEVEKVNPFSGRLTLVVDSRLDAVSNTRWYVVADPARYDGLEWAHLDSEPGPTIDTRHGFNIDGMEVKVRLDFGAGFIEHRSWYANDGAEGGEE